MVFFLKRFLSLLWVEEIVFFHIPTISGSFYYYYNDRKRIQKLKRRRNFGSSKEFVGRTLNIPYWGLRNYILGTKISLRPKGL